MEKDAEVIDAFHGVVERNGRWCFRMCFDRLRIDGRPWNHKRVWRVYFELGLHIPHRTKRRIAKREPVPLAAGSYVNQGWTLDLMYDVLFDDRRFRTRNVIDEDDRKSLTIQVAQSLSASMLIRTMDRLVDWGVPTQKHRTELHRAGLAQPERLHRALRPDVPDRSARCLFNSIEQVQAIADGSLIQYNKYRPHHSLGGAPLKQRMPRLITTTAAD